MSQLIAAILCGIALCFVSPAFAAPASPPADDQPGAEDGSDLDEQLRKQLSDDLLDGLDEELGQDKMPAVRPETGRDQPPADGSDVDPNAVEDGAEGIDQELLKQLTGQDLVGGTQEESPLERAGRRMREVERRIARATVDAATQRIGDQIVADLDELLAELRKRSQQSNQSNSSSQEQSSRRTQTSPGQPSAGSAGSTAGSSNEAARDSANQLRNRKPEDPDPANRQDLLKSLWGHLPERMREQMLQSSMDGFLPQYEMLIEEYFRRLVEAEKDQTR